MTQDRLHVVNTRRNQCSSNIGATIAVTFAKLQ